MTEDIPIRNNINPTLNEILRLVTFESSWHARRQTSGFGHIV